MKPIDIEIERARRTFDGPEAYPGELLEAVLVGLVGDMQRPGVGTSEARAELVNLCQRITARVAEREQCPAAALSSNELCSRIVRVGFPLSARPR